MHCIGENIKNIREQNRLTQQELADQLQIPLQTVIDWETDVSQPDITQLQYIAKKLKTDVNHLTYGNPPSTSSQYLYKHKGAITQGISFGSCLAMVVSFVTWKSIPWAILHGFLGWFYVIYYFFKYSK